LWGSVCMHIAFNAANFSPVTDAFVDKVSLMVAVFVCTFMLACVGSKKAESY